MKFLKKYGLPYYLLTIYYFLLSTSCQKVINLNLNSANPVLVVVGTVTDQPGPYTVNLTQTVNFSQNNTFPPVQGALVAISDNAGNYEVLKNTSPGNYTTSLLQGVPGRTYTLSVTANGKTYTATSTMPQPDTIASLAVDSAVSSRYGGGVLSIGTFYSIEATIQDPAGSATHYYRFIEQVNTTEENNIYILSDEFENGQLLHRKLSSGDTSIVAGDSVTVYLQCIDYPVYNYFNTLNQTIRNATGVIQVSDPGNPITNLSNNALGYFSACTLRSRKIRIP